MKISVEIDASSVGATATLFVQMRDESMYASRLWSTRKRCFDVAELDDIWAALIDELGVQQILALG